MEQRTLVLNKTLHSNQTCHIFTTRR